jgi:hypothetical protein
MAHRRPRARVAAVASGALLLASPLLAGCGFDKATNRVYTPAMGVNERDGDVDVLGAVIVSSTDGSGTFVATLANNSSTDDAALSGIQSNGEPAITAQVEPVEVPVRGSVNLADEGGVPVEGDFVAGDFVPVTVSFEGADTVDMEVPVVPDTEEFEGLDTGSSAASE